MRGGRSGSSLIALSGFLRHSDNGESMPKNRKQRRVPSKLLVLRDRFVSVAGRIETVTVETSDDPRKIDHVWLEVCAGEQGLLQIALNTRSRKNAEAGYDPRVWVGIITSSWMELPAAGVLVVEPLDYAKIEAAHPINFVPYDRAALEELLVKKTKAACFARGWGEFYVRAHLGIHQVHSRRASFAHRVDRQGQDGALELYFDADRRRELLLFKFVGQP